MPHTVRTLMEVRPSEIHVGDKLVIVPGEYPYLGTVESVRLNNSGSAYFVHTDRGGYRIGVGSVVDIFRTEEILTQAKPRPARDVWSGNPDTDKAWAKEVI